MGAACDGGEAYGIYAGYLVMSNLPTHHQYMVRLMVYDSYKTHPWARVMLSSYPAGGS